MKNSKILMENKTDNFLNAIKKYADEQRNAMRSEAEQLKDEKLKEARRRGRRDSEKYIRERLEKAKNKQTSALAKKIQDNQRELFVMRAEMTEKVFKMAEEKLVEYTKTADYAAGLVQSAREIAEVFGSNDCIIYVNGRDSANADKIKAKFKGKVEVEADKSIKIGGLKGYCKAMRIVADETLDSKLSAQREWFTENSNLSVL